MLFKIIMDGMIFLSSGDQQFTVKIKIFCFILKSTFNYTFEKLFWSVK